MKTALSIVFVVIAIALAIIVLMQEGKSQGLSGTLGGGNETYWSKNKGRSKDAVMVKITVALTVIFFVLAILLSSKWL